MKTSASLASAALALLLFGQPASAAPEGFNASLEAHDASDYEAAVAV